MPGGRPKKPTGLHVVQGTFRADRHNAQEPQPELKAPPCPRHVQGEQRKIYRWLVRLLRPMRVLSLVDGLMLEGLSAQIVTFRKAHQGSNILLIKSPKSGWPVKNPIIQTRDDAWHIIVDIAGKFGMDPRSRTQLKVEIQKPIDEFEAYQKRKA